MGAAREPVLLRTVVDTRKDPLGTPPDLPLFVTPRPTNCTKPASAAARVWGIGLEALARMLHARYPVHADIVESISAIWRQWEHHQLLQWTGQATAVIVLPIRGRTAWQPPSNAWLTPPEIKRFWWLLSPVRTPRVINQSGATSAARDWAEFQWHERGSILSQRDDSPFVFDVAIPPPHPQRTDNEDRRFRAKADKILRLLLFTAATWIHHESYPKPQPRLSLVPESLRGWSWAPADANAFTGTCTVTGNQITLRYSSFNQPPVVEGGVIPADEQREANWLVMSADPHLHRCPLFEPDGCTLSWNPKKKSLLRLHRIWAPARRAHRAKSKGRRDGLA